MTRRCEVQKSTQLVKQLQAEVQRLREDLEQKDKQNEILRLSEAQRLTDLVEENKHLEAEVQRLRQKDE